MSCPTPLTRPLQVVTAVAAFLFAVGSAVHGFAVVDTSLIETMMRAAGAADPAAEAPGFTTGFRIVGAGYVLANAVGVLTWWSRSRLLWWWILAVNATQGLGYLMIPAEMWPAIHERYGPIGAVPSLVTDGGAALLAVVFLATMVRYRTTWARRRVTATAGAR